MADDQLKLVIVTEMTIAKCLFIVYTPQNAYGELGLGVSIAGRP
jgi:hypothetical protein